MGFSLLGKKKLKEQHVAKVFVGTLNDLAEKTFPTLSEFLNEVPELMESPKIKSNQMEWFLYIVFSTNLYNLQHHFESNQLNRMRILVIDEFMSESGNILNARTQRTLSGRIVRSSKIQTIGIREIQIRRSYS